MAKETISKISVIIPTYNRANLIENSIRSVLNQTYSDFELIVSDDGSTDNTEDVVRSIGDERIVFLKTDENKGAGGARNAGVKASSCDYIAFHDSDDVWMPDKLEKQIRYMSEHSDIAMVYGKMHFIDDDKEWDFPTEDEKGKEGEMLFPYLLVRNIIGAPTIMIKKRVFDEVGGFREDIRALEDWDFALKVAREYGVGFINEVLMDVHVTNGSVSSNIPAYYMTRAKMIAEYKDDMIKYGIFDHCVLELFNNAEKRGLLSLVQQYLMKYLSML